MPVVPPSPAVAAAEHERRKWGMSLGHLQRWRAGQVPLVNTVPPIEQALQRQVDAGHGPFTAEQLQQHLRLHHDAFATQPQRALLLRPQAPGFAVKLPAGRVGQGYLAYDLHGRVQVQLPDLLVGASPYTLRPAGRHATLSAADLDRIGHMRDALEGGHTYSTLARALVLARAVRQARAHGMGPTTFAGALAHLQVPGDQVLAAYGGGSCMHMAQVLAAQVSDRFGLPAHIATERIAAGTAIERPRLTGWGIEHSQPVLDAIGGQSHTNVMVPYFDPSGQARVLRISTGVGLTANAQAGGRPAPMRSWSAAQRVAAEAADPNLPQERLVGHPQRLMANAMPSSAKLHVHRWDNGMTLGLDLLRRSLYLNHAAAAAAPGAVSQIDLDHPSAKDDLPACLGDLTPKTGQGVPTPGAAGPGDRSAEIPM